MENDEPYDLDSSLPSKQTDSTYPCIVCDKVRELVGNPAKQCDSGKCLESEFPKEFYTAIYKKAGKVIKVKNRPLGSKNITVLVG